MTSPIPAVPCPECARLRDECAEAARYVAQLERDAERWNVYITRLAIFPDDMINGVDRLIESIRAASAAQPPRESR